MKRPRASIHYLFLLGAITTGALLRLQTLPGKPRLGFAGGLVRILSALDRRPPSRRARPRPARSRSGGRAVGRQSLRCRFPAHSSERVAFQSSGLLLLQSRSDPGSWIGAHRVLGAADSQLVVELPAYVTAARPIKVLGRDKRLWYLEAVLVRVKAGEYYGLTTHAAPAGRQKFSDIRAYFFADG